MYYKGVQDGVVLEVWDDGIQCVKRMNGAILRCGIKDAPFGVLARDCSVIYALDGSEGYEQIELKTFEDPVAYEEMKAEIDEGRSVPEPEPEPDPERPISIAEMRAAIARMQTELYGADMTAHENFAKDVYFSIGIRLFQALEPIAAGEQIEPGKNCKEISAAETLNKLNESEE